MSGMHQLLIYVIGDNGFSVKTGDKQGNVVRLFAMRLIAYDWTQATNVCFIEEPRVLKVDKVRVSW